MRNGGRLSDMRPLVGSRSSFRTFQTAMLTFQDVVFLGRALSMIC